MSLKKIEEVVLNALVYRSTSILIQLAMVSVIFGLTANWMVVVSCNVLCFLWYILYHLMAIKVRRGMRGDSLSGRKYIAYMSHPIRGAKGDAASKEDQMRNSAIAREGAIKLRNAIHDLDVYCPGDAEKFVFLSYSKKWLTDKQILDIDCEIEGDCDFLLVYEFDKLGSGCHIEIDYAKDRHIPVFRFSEVNSKTISELRRFIKQLETGAVGGFSWVVS